VGSVQGLPRGMGRSSSPRAEAFGPRGARRRVRPGPNGADEPGRGHRARRDAVTSISRLGAGARWGRLSAPRRGPPTRLGSGTRANPSTRDPEQRGPFGPGRRPVAGVLTTLGFCCATTMPTPGREVQAEWPGSLMPTAPAANPS